MPRPLKPPAVPRARPADEPDSLPRRRFSTHVGAAAALTVAGSALALNGAPVQAQTGTPPRSERLAAMLNLFARDTFAGVSAYMVPGNDLYSLVQGRSTWSAGGIAAKNDAFLVFMFDHYLPIPGVPQLAAGLGAPLRGLLLPLGDGTYVDLGTALTEGLAGQDSLPLATLLALLLNGVALAVRPASVIGPFLSPFSRLAWATKAQVFELLETPGADTMAMVGRELGQDPLSKALIGYVQLIGLGLQVFAASGSYSEWAYLDTATRTLRSRPVGWTLSQYQPFGPVEGWDEFRGYYQGRRSASDA